LDIEIKNDKILKRFFSNIEKRISWNSVINEFNPEFEKYKRLFFIDAILAEDGSLQNNEKRIYSKR
jgi:BirA family biotin operon repressor/biotin-[acetyl-CoA-carboxylase] ligase